MAKKSRTNNGTPSRCREGIGSNHRSTGDGKDGKDGKDGYSRGVGGNPVEEICEWICRYMAIPEDSAVVVATWIVAARFMAVWDRFPHLAIQSPEKRCGKTRLLELLEWLVHEPLFTSNISPAALFRVIVDKRPTLLLDEAQQLIREGFEILREILCAAITHNATIVRCSGKDHEPKEFPIFCPKVVALIGKLDGVLSDRCLGIILKRKSPNEVVESYRHGKAKEQAEPIVEGLKEWVEKNKEKVEEIYKDLDPLPIENDRFAELLLPLQTVLEVVGDEDLKTILSQYAVEIDKADAESESIGIQLLIACRDIFKEKDNPKFIGTEKLISALVDRVEEPWATFSKRGEKISPRDLARHLKPYGIEPTKAKIKKAERDKKPQKEVRGYFQRRFEEAWERYLPHS